MRAVFLDYATIGGAELDLTPLRNVIPDLELFDVTPTDRIIERIENAECVLVNKVRLDAHALSAARQLRYIGLAATGVDNIDLAAAGSRNVAVANIRAYCTQSVVEHVFASLLSLTHHINGYARDVRAGKWQSASTFCLLDRPIRELSAMTLGIVGYGTLGKAVADKAADFGMRVVIAQRPGVSRTEDPANTGGRLPLDELLARADVVSLHCPLTDTTRGLIDAAALARMKPSAILINTARGALVDSAALRDALQRGRIAAAAVDVLPVEPPVDGDPLLDYGGDNLLLTPHIAWATLTARQNAIDQLAENLRAFVAGRRQHRVDE